MLTNLLLFRQKNYDAVFYDDDNEDDDFFVWNGGPIRRFPIFPAGIVVGGSRYRK